MKADNMKRNDEAIAKHGRDGQRGFTLIETTISLLVMMVVALGAASLFVFALGTNTTGRDRELSMAVAQQQMERLRNAKFADLDTTLTATGGANKTVTSGERSYSVVTTIVNTISGNSTQKTITIQVTPKGTNTTGSTSVQRVFGGVTLVTQRSTTVHGPYRF
jgi:Tfp pilus assembly protein PilV